LRLSSAIPQGFDKLSIADFKRGSRMSVRSKRFLPVVGLVLSAFLAILGSRAQSSTTQAPPSSKLAEEQFKNIQVLKGIPADQILPAMQFITSSLGVECEFCHVREARGLAFDKDDKKPKIAARKMIQMMFAINKENFEGKREVTCYSCHRGAANPIATPIIAKEELQPEAGVEKSPSEAQTAPPAADQLLDKYVAALGGAAAVQKITSRVEKGTLSAFGGQHFPVDIYQKAPDKRISIMHLRDGDSTTAFDGHSGWLSVPGRSSRAMTAEENDAARMDADLYFPIHLKVPNQKFVVQPGEKMDGHETNLVVVRGEGQPPLRLYFDSQSGLLLRLVRYAETPLGRIPTQIDYADYRDADGVKVPFRWTLARPDNRFTIQVDQLQQNVPIDDARFIAPPAPALPQK
jgi:photosynthetic reaction center cytochrome c subunit